MIKALLAFYAKLIPASLARLDKLLSWLAKLFLPKWMTRAEGEPEHFHGRRFTSKYRKKRRIVFCLWVLVAGVALAEPGPQFLLGLCLFTIFLSLAILDETA